MERLVTDKYPYKPKYDGTDHINTYSKGQTWLGKQLSNFAHSPILLPEEGAFASIEGYWYWLKTGNDELRTLYGPEAKNIGRKSKSTISISQSEFESRIKIACQFKLKQNLSILHGLKETTLPLVHYYVKKEGCKRIADPKHGADWLWHHYMVLRAKLRKEPEPTPIVYSYIKEDNSSKNTDGTLSLF